MFVGRVHIAARWVETASVSQQRHALIDVDVEFDAVVRRFEGLVHQVRMEKLGRDLETGGPLAVRHSTCGFCGDRFSIWLDNGTVLKLKLLWPRRCALSAITRVRWDVHVGWAVGARTTSGALVDLNSWKATVNYR